MNEQYPKYYYAKAIHKVICLKNETTFIVYQCHRDTRTGEERLGHMKMMMPSKELLHDILEEFQPCTQEEYTVVLRDFFAKTKEYRDLFATIDRKQK